MIDFLKKQLFTVHQNGKQQVSEVFKYIGPGIIVTVGFWTIVGSYAIYDYAYFIAT